MKRATLVDGATHDVGGVGVAVAQAGSTSTWPRVVQEEASRPHVACVEARAKASRPRVVRATTQGGVPRVEGEPDQTRGGSRDQWVWRSQQGETHLCRKQCDER
jgi:hypothetical protein